MSVTSSLAKKYQVCADQEEDKFAQFIRDNKSSQNLEKLEVFDKAYKALGSLIKDFDKIKSAKPVVVLAKCRNDLAKMAMSLPSRYD